MEQDNLKLPGSFFLQVIEVCSNKVIETYEEKNLVVALGRANICKLLGGDAAGVKISKIGFGTNGTNPDLLDTALTGAFSKNITSVAYPQTNQVAFSWSLEANEANGMTILELGLLNDAGVLCARKVRSAIVKTAVIKLVGTWTLTIN